MKNHWKNWCRLCGNSAETTEIKENPDILFFLSYYFQITSRICACESCNNTINYIKDFITKSRKVQEMFLELEISAKSLNSNDVNQLRTKFDLELLTTPFESVKVEVMEENVDDGFPEVKIEDDPGQIKEDLEEKDKLLDFSCHICSIKCQKLGQLEAHCKKEHNCQPLVHCVCGDLTTRSTIRRHMLQHCSPDSKLMLICDHCGHRYQKGSKSKLELHMIKYHSSTAVKYDCPNCPGRSFPTKWQLNKHRADKHLPVNQEARYSCDLCPDKFYKRKTSLWMHKHTNHNANLQEFYCETCFKSFKTMHALAAHQEWHSEEFSYVCTECPAKFKTKKSLWTHKSLHSGKIFQCLECPQKFNSKRGLQHHAVTHSDVRKYKCTICHEKSYKRAKDLKQHLNLHNGIFPYSCENCGKQFVNISNCKKHKMQCNLVKT